MRPSPCAPRSTIPTAMPGTEAAACYSRPGSPGVGLRQLNASPHTAPRQQGADARGTARPRRPSRTLTPAGALLRSRPAVCRQPRCASHNQAAHTGRLSTIAYTAIAIGPSNPATTDAATVTAPSPIQAQPARAGSRAATRAGNRAPAAGRRERRRPAIRQSSAASPAPCHQPPATRAPTRNAPPSSPQARPAAKAAPAARTRGARSSMAYPCPAPKRESTRGA